MMRSEDFSFSFAENISKFVILKRDIGKIRSFCKFCGVSLNVQRIKTELEPRSFNACKNAAAPMIVMLDHSELDMEVSDAGMETVESNNCREMSRKNRDANSVLATMLEGARFSYKDRWKFIGPFTQSISGLC